MSKGIKLHKTEELEYFEALDYLFSGIMLMLNGRIVTEQIINEVFLFEDKVVFEIYESIRNIY